MTHYLIAVDLGKLRDHSAITVIERSTFPSHWDQVNLCHVYQTKNVLRKIERLSLGTSYQVVIERITAWVHELSPQGQVTLLVDATGVGQPVVDSLHAANLDCRLVPVTITSGEHASRSSAGWNVPKKDLIVSLQLMIARNELLIPHNLPLREKLSDELASISRNLRAEGTRHDDLALSLSLAAWRLQTQRQIGPNAGPLPY